MKINTNLSSLIVQSSLKSSTNGLNTAIERMTTGFKINHAKDNAANYSINTKLSTKISGYEVAEDNASQALNMVNTALGALSVMSDYSSRLRSLSMQVQNGTYGNKSIDAINAEAVSIINELYRTKNNAEYNGISLFGGLEQPSDITFPDGTPEKKYEFMVEVVHRDTSQMTSVSSLDESIVTTGGSYSVSSVEEIEKAFSMINSGKLKSAELVLANDVDYSEFTGTHATAFGINFDGNGYIISNFSSTSSFLGQNSKVKNLGLENVNISSNNDGTCAFGGGAIKLSNCYATGFVKGRNNVGGLVGNVKGCVIKNSYADVEVRGECSIGGLIGAIDENDSFRIENCYTEGSVNSSIYTAGGLIGWARIRGDVKGVINNCVSTSSVTSRGNNDAVGGLIGDFSVSGTLNMTNCYAVGEVSSGTNSGGLIGQFTIDNPEKCSISNIYYNMESTGQNDTGKGVGLSSSELNKMVAKGHLPDYGLDLPLPDIYDTSSRPLYSPAFVTFQVGISGEDSAGIYQDLSFTIEGLKDLCYLGLDDEKSLEKIDEMIASISSKELELGALQNRLESVLEQVGVAYDNLVSTQSTIRDADIAEESSAYIRNQILQQAATTLMATANQTPAIALQLL
ncbi:TPA: hypothetical protein CPT87_02120 [Candidatus Gastranaerophilales bacterium HUM_5]|nr:MAG TPA: hypothetical protein CPT99_03670 [Candidatus Gastranaerophilales bacterium HUM_4]DAA92346.1 MAG TPA: hypothetical protein CPT87_02120 [Candidatus Gastranaerophilales bacterium HUM_5]